MKNATTGFCVKEKYKFVNCIFVCTSNLHQEEIVKAFNKKASVDEIKVTFDKLCGKKKYTEISRECLKRLEIIPFGPIPKGDPFQAILKKELKSYFENLKEDFKFKEVGVEKEEQVLQTLEKLWYTDGTDMRAIKTYFKEFTDKIRKEQKILFNTSNCKDVKLMFFAQDNKLFIKTDFFVEQFMLYKPLNEKFCFAG